MTYHISAGSKLVSTLRETKLLRPVPTMPAMKAMKAMKGMKAMKADKAMKRKTAAAMKKAMKKVSIFHTTLIKDDCKDPDDRCRTLQLRGMRECAAHAARDLLEAAKAATSGAYNALAASRQAEEAARLATLASQYGALNHNEHSASLENNPASPVCKAPEKNNKC